jgi:hypothetical protein
MSDDEANVASAPAESGFLARQHNKLRFDELSESFFARVLLLKCSDPTSKEIETVHLSLRDLFRALKPGELETKLTGLTFTLSSKMTEMVADFVSTLTGSGLHPHAENFSAFDYYENHIGSRLKWLKAGDQKNDKQPCIEDFEAQRDGSLVVFHVRLRPAVLVERLSHDIETDFELNARLLRKIEKAQYRPSEPGPRVDYRKQVGFLTEYLEGRQKTTGETEFSFLSTDIPFRWLLLEVPIGGGFTMPGTGTTTAGDRVLLPLFLEINGFLDIVGLDIESDPLKPTDVVVRYAVHKPAVRNIFGASNEGLDAAARARLTETELALYARLHRTLRENLVLGGRPKLEMSFGACCSWFLRKAAYCLEEPTFLGNPAREWLKRHKDKRRLQMEDEFFLPAIYERLRNDFGSRVVKKPKRFGGEIDILFDDTIPIELKVRRGRRKPLSAADVDEAFPPSGQAAAYAAISRVGFLIVLDLPERAAVVTSLEASAKVITRRFPKDSAYPTCIVLIVFRCYQAKPSAMR